MTGPCGDNWLLVAQYNIQTRIIQNVESSFNVMKLCADPRKAHKEELARIVRTIEEVEKRLGEVMEDWRAFVGYSLGSSSAEIMASCNLTLEDIDKADYLPAFVEALDVSAPNELLRQRQQLANGQMKSENDYMTEVASTGERSVAVATRLHDLTPHIYNSVQAMSDARVLKNIAQGVSSPASE